MINCDKAKNMIKVQYARFTKKQKKKRERDVTERRREQIRKNESERNILI